MSKQTDKSLFIVSSLPGLYQALLSGIESHKDLGNRIVKEIKPAHAFRQVEKVAELSRILVNNPIKEYRLIGEYYLAWSKYRGEESQPRTLERIIEQSKTYKTKALTFRGALSFYKGRLDEAMLFYLESLKSKPTASEYLLSVKEIAVIKSIEGFKESALKDLETLLPLLKHADPFASADVLNSYAVVLGEAGREHEARNIIKHVIASPLIVAYPEWQETANELKEPNRSFIPVPQPALQIERKHVEIKTRPAPTEKEEKSADVLPFQKLKEAPPPPKPDDIYQSQLNDMTTDQKSQLLMSLILSKAIPNRHINKMLMAAGVVKRDSSAKEIDLEDLGLVADLMSDWCNMIDPGLFIGVMSAIRDCVNYTRQKNIIDSFISEAIRQTDDSIETEDEYRRKYERKLPEE